VYDKEVNAYKFKASFGWDMKLIKDVNLSLEEAEERYLRKSKEIFEDVFFKNDPLPENSNFVLDELERPACMTAVVVKIKNKVEGFLLLENMKKNDAFSMNDFSLIKNLKEHIISAFIKTKILEDLKKTLDNLKDTQNQLIQQEKLASLGQLTAGIAHEIQNPLNFVNNFSQLSADLADELRDIIQDEKDHLTEDSMADMEEIIGMIESNVKKINEHGQRASRIVKGMLQHSRGKSGDFQLTDLNRMIEEYINLAFHGVRAENKEFNTAIKFDFDPTVGEVNIVPQDLSRVILNIMNNGCYAVNEKKMKLKESFSPEISVKSERKDKYVVISIKDNGTGMPEHVKEKIFQPFFTTKPTGKGTGLGLSMSYDIVTTMHKGKFEVNSKDGEYTEFIIQIPVNL